jgi:succinate dehydrogenase / fumarate reductase flavoprotein subunit
MYERFAELGVDMAEEPVEVAPTAHYGMGGVVVDEHGETEVDGLYAIGETMVGVHGANRLGGNSLAETIAYGKLTGQAVARRLGDTTSKRGHEGLLHSRAHQHFSDLDRLTGSNGGHGPEALLDQLRHCLWNAAGIRRDEAGIAAGLDALEEIYRRASDLAVGDRTSRSFEYALDLGFALVVAESILRSARERTESRGAHFRTDHPERDPDWRRNIRVTHDSIGAMHLTTHEVGTPSAAVQRALDADYELDYHQLE